jgi:hypothetical protein
MTTFAETAPRKHVCAMLDASKTVMSTLAPLIEERCRLFSAMPRRRIAARRLFTVCLCRPRREKAPLIYCRNERTSSARHDEWH